VNVIQLPTASNVGVISVCSDGSSSLQFTMTGLSSSTPHVIFAPLRALRKKGGVRFSHRRLQRLCEEPAMRWSYAEVGVSSRRSCRSRSECRSAPNDCGLLKILVRRCHLATFSWYGPLEVMTEVVLGMWWCEHGIWSVNALWFMMKLNGRNYYIVRDTTLFF